MKVVQMPTSGQDFKKLADVAIASGDVVQGLKYLSSAIKAPNLKAKELAKYKTDYARALSMRCKYGYSNEILFGILADDKKNKEVMSLIMYNYQALNMQDQAKYYYDKCASFLEKRKNDFKSFISNAPGDILMIDGEEIPLDEITEEEIDGFLGTNLIKDLNTPKKPSIFTVIDNKSKFQDLVAEMYNCAAKQDFAGAIDCANKALELNVKKTDKIVPLYTKGVALMLMGYSREAMEHVNRVLEEYPNDYSVNILKCELLSSINDKSGLKDAMEFFKTRPLDEVLPFDRIMGIYLRNKLYQEGLDFVKPRMEYFSDSYTLNIYLGMLYFNLGEVQKAKEVLSEINGLYGDLCDARHLLNYINYGIKKPLIVSPQIGDIIDLSAQYLNEFCMFLEQEGKACASWATLDISNFIAKLKWIALNKSPDIAIAVVEKIYVLRSDDLTPHLQAKMRELKRELAKLILTVDDLPDVIKECIVHYILLSHGKADIVVDGKFFSADPMLDIYAMPNNFMRALVRAFAYSIARGEEMFMDTLRFANNLNALYQEKKFNWKSDMTIFAVIMYYVYGQQDLEMVIPGFKYNKKLFAKYIQELA